MQSTLQNYRYYFKTTEMMVILLVIEIFGFEIYNING